MLEAVRGVAQHGLARLPWEQEVAGSNPVAPTIKKVVQCSMFHVQASIRDLYVDANSQIIVIFNLKLVLYANLTIFVLNKR